MLYMYNHIKFIIKPIEFNEQNKITYVFWDLQNVHSV